MSRACFSSADSVAPGSSTLITTDSTHPASYTQSLGSSMTTYYHYGEDGLIYASTGDPDSLSAHEDPVGAYLAQRAQCYPACAGLGAHHPQELMSGTDVQQDGDHMSQEGSEQDWSGREYDSYHCMSRSVSNPTSSIGYADWAISSDREPPYLDPDHIRHLHTLHSLLPCLQPERKLNSLGGPTLDIVTQDTNTVLAHAVPKKLLVLFLGRQVVTKYIKTVEHEDTKNWRSRATCQILSVPQGLASRIAVQILVSWMTQACQSYMMAIMPSIEIPANAFAACSLAQTMSLFGLHRDALRLDIAISKQHFQRPINAAELEALWKCMGQDNRYVYAATKAVGKWIQAYDKENPKHSHRANQMIALLDKHPQLGARVRDLELNEQHRPVYGVQWMQDLSSHRSSYAENASYGKNRTGLYASSHQVYGDTDSDRTAFNMQPSSINMNGQDVQSPLIVANSSQSIDPQNLS